ncbi:MAG TPA: IPT/TIG domain-containing protein [Thermoanaerobaculia bacterium]
MRIFFSRHSCIVLLLLAALRLSAATHTVTSTSDSGPGSLRQALLAAAAGDRIEFAIGSGPVTIQPLTNLPAVSQPNVVIDGRTQPGYAGEPIVEIDGALIAGYGTSVVGLNLTKAEVYGLVINNFAGTGIDIETGKVQNCYIGTNASGTAARGNDVGIRAGGVLIGGPDGSGNLIAGNSTGIQASENTSIQGNVFGSNAAQTSVIGAFSRHVRIDSRPAANANIGSVVPNVFAGGEVGVSLFYSSKVTIARNFFGRTPEGRSFPIRTAIQITDSSENTVQSNTIRGNAVGVLVIGNSLRNRIIANAMEDNGLGIDLWSSYSYSYGQATPNDDDDSDTGPNNLINFPILGRVTNENGETTIRGTLATVPNRSHRIELFSSPGCNGSGYGEGKTLLEAFDLTTDGSGTASFLRAHSPLPAGTVITATATSELEGTSEFSPCRALEGPGTFSFDWTSAYEYEGGTVSLTVRRLGGAAGAASVSYAVSGGTATAGDFTGGSGTLTFADGETARNLTLQTTEDSFFEDTETIVLALSGATNGASIGSPAAATVTIYDDDPEPVVSLQSLEIAEGDSGTTVVEMPITLSAPATEPYTVVYEIRSWYATPGVDFIAETGSITFAPGETAKHVPVSILGDNEREGDEWVNVTVLDQWWVSATVTIRDDDPIPTVSAEDLRIPEGNATATASVTIRAPYAVTGWVFVRLVSGSAQASSDFQSRWEYLFFSHESSKTFAVTILGDEEPEPSEQFTVEVQPLYGDFTAGPNATVTLVNDDIGVGPAEQWIAAGRSRTFVIQLGEDVTEDATIGLTSGDPSAVSVPEMLTIPAGRQSAEFDATALVPGKNVDVAIAFPPRIGGGGTRSVRVRTYTKATLRFSPARLNVFDGKTATVSVSLDPPSATPITLGVRASDRVDVPRSLTIPPGGSASLLVTAAKLGSFTIDLRLPPVHGNELQSLYGDVIAEPQTPTILSLTPSHGPASGDTEVTIHGAHFRAGCTVAFGGVSATSAKVTNATTMTAATPPHAPGSVDVLLQCGSDSFLFPDGFGYVAEAPRVTNVSPSGGTAAGGTHVRVEGAGFDGSCWLFFGELAATSVVVRDPQSITGVAPPHAAGAADVTVRCSGGTSTLPQAFTYRDEDDPAPLITAIVPPAAAPGELVTVHGLNFRPTDGATVETTLATIVDSAPGHHVIPVPELPAGRASLFVRDILGRTTTSGPVFSVLEARPPRITAAAPASVAAGGELELTGEGFRAGYTFEIGGQPAAIVSSEYTRAVVRVATEVVPGSQAVHVRNGAGILAAIGPLVEIVEGGMIVTSADPRCTTTDGGVYATIHGRGFAGSVAVTFDGVPSADVVAIDGGTMRVEIPPGAAGSARISVTDDMGRTATLTNGFRYVSPFDPQGCGRRARAIRE